MNAKIDSIQALRAIAVILVVYIHSFIFGENTIQAHFFLLSTWGAIGVDLFFVISGFIMTRVIPSYTGSGDKAWAFMLKRIIRIFPLYWLVSLATWVLNTKATQLESIYKTLAFFPLIDKNYFIYPIIAQGWTLPYEIYFYSIIFIALYFIRKRILESTFIILLSVNLIGAFLAGSSFFLNFLTSPLLLEFILGIIIGQCYNIIKDRNYSEGRESIIKVVGIASLIFGVVLMVSTIFLPKNVFFLSEILINGRYLAFKRVLFWGLPSALLVFGSLNCEYFFRIKIPAFLIKVGDASSYSCYLIHFALIRTLERFLKHFQISFNGDLVIVLCLVGSVMLSLLMYKYIEHPLITTLNNRFFRFKKTSKHKLAKQDCYHTQH